MVNTWEPTEKFDSTQGIPLFATDLSQYKVEPLDGEDFFVETTIKIKPDENVNGPEGELTITHYKCGSSCLVQ